jgi:hypothetical protein
MKENVLLEMAKMKSLMNRIENRMTPYEAVLNEEKLLNEVRVPKDVVLKSADEFFDIMDQSGAGKFFTMGCVFTANIEPTVKRKNPLTNRMKSYEDYSVFGEGSDDIAAIVSLVSYNRQYQHRDTVSKEYGLSKEKENEIRRNYGAPEVGEKNGGYKEKVDWGKHGAEVYKGSNEELQGNTYHPINVHHSKTNITKRYFVIGKDGHILRELDEATIKPFLKKKTGNSGANALRRLGTEEETIKAYLDEIDKIGMTYINPKGDSILYIASAINGQKIRYINENMKRCVNDINIAPEDFLKIARERYQIDSNQVMQQN